MGGGMVLGVDVGQTTDPPAVVAVVPVGMRPGGGLPVWRVVRAEALPLGMPYEVLARLVVALLGRCAGAGFETWAVIDRTGIGRAVVEQVRAARPPGEVVGATITGGKKVVPRWPDVSVPKSLLVDGVTAALEHDGLVVDEGLRDGAGLRRQLKGFEQKRDAATGRVTSGAVTAALHDDLVLALALAGWGLNHAYRMASGALAVDHLRVGR